MYDFSLKHTYVRVVYTKIKDGFHWIFSGNICLNYKMRSLFFECKRDLPAGRQEFSPDLIGFERYTFRDSG